MAARASLALLAVLMLAWLGVLVRGEVVASSAGHRLFWKDGLTAQEVDRELERLRGTALLNPDKEWRIKLARFMLLHDRRGDAARQVEAVVRDEPANLPAWVLLAQATGDASRRAEAQARIRELSPR